MGEATCDEATLTEPPGTLAWRGECCAALPQLVISACEFSVAGGSPTTGEELYQRQRRYLAESNQEFNEFQLERELEDMSKLSQHSRQLFFK